MATTLQNIIQLGKDRLRDPNSFSVDWTNNAFRATNGMLQTWNQEHDWPWQLEEMQFNYNEGIDTYDIANTIDFKAIVNVHPYLQTEKKDTLYYLGQNKFDSDSIHQHKFAIQLKGQTQILRCKYKGYNAYIEPASSPTSNGTWVGAGAISNLTTDTYDFFEQTSSISFNYSGTSGTLTNSTFAPVDLSRYVARGNVYCNFYLQSVANFTSITLRLGSDASDYITVTATADYLGNTPVVGWNRFAFPWTGSTTTVGTIVPTAIAYAQLTLAYSSTTTVTNCNFESLWVAENIPMVLDYYSNNMVVDTTGNKTQIFTNAANTSDTPLWTGTWDFVNEPFVDSMMETVFRLTGEQEDEQDVQAQVQSHLEPLKARLPSKRRYPEFNLTPDLNGAYYGPRPVPYRQYLQP